MHLLAPVSLLAIAPWLASAIWLLRGARESSRVPFLPLWRGSEAQPRTHRRMRAPPLPILLALLAALLGILAAARPSFTATPTLHDPIILIVDRGLAMSARTPTGYRFTDTAGRVTDELKKRFPSAHVKLILVPGGPPETVPLFDLPRQIQSLSPTALDTRQALTDVIAGQDTTGKSQILVITDQDIPDNRIIRIPPSSPVQDVAIARLSVRDVPTTQAMIEVRNQSTRTKAALRISSGSTQLDRQIELPPAPQTRNYFFDLPTITDTVQARLVDPDDISADDTAWSVRERSFPRIEPRSPLPPAISRIIEAYSKARPVRPGSDSSRIVIVTDSAALPSTETGAILLPAQERASEPIVATDHQITRHINWQNLSRVRRATTPPPQGWTPVLTAGPNALIGIKPANPRQVWIGFDADQWESTTDFVIFWTNVFDYLGDTDATTFTSHPLSEWAPPWTLAGATSGEWPGLYTRSDNQTRAFNAPDMILKPPSTSDWETHLSEFSTQHGSYDLSPTLFLCALACLLASAALWR